MSRGTNFKRFNSQSRELVQLQGNIQSAFSQVLLIPILNGVLLENLEIVAGDNTITHKLGRRIRGYLVTRKNSASDIYDKISTDTALDQSFTLNSSADCIISLWVF